MRLTWPLIGRCTETRLIEAALRDPESAGIVVSGAAGVGKSRILRETLDTLTTQGWETRWIVGTSAVRTLPLGALTPWARSTDVDNLHLVNGVISALTATPSDGAVVIGVDDAPLLDDLSTVVVHQIIQRRLAKLILIVRDGEPVPAATRELWQAGEFDWLTIRPLPELVTAMLVSRTLGGPLDSQAAERLWRMTEGNPLYLRNIVEQEVADGRLALNAGLWTWHGDPIVPPGLIELVEAKIGGLSDAVSEVVDVVAVSEPIELRALTAITSAAAVEEADRRGLISLEAVDHTMQVRLAHPLYGEVRRSRAARTTLRRLRGLVATELATSDHRGDAQIVVRRATLAMDSDLDPDVDLLLEAARCAAWLFDLPLADRLAAAAARAGGGVEASLIRAFVLSWLGAGADAESVLAAVDTGALSDREHGRLTFLRAVNLFFTLADPAAAIALADRHAAVDARSDHRSVDAFLCVYWAAMGNPAAARAAAHRFDRNALPDHLQARLTAWAATVACGEAGSTTEAVATAESGYPVPVRAFIVIADAHISALLLAGLVGEAQDVAATMRERAAALHGAPFSQIAMALSGQAALGAGRLDTACDQLAAALERVTSWNAATGFGYRYRILLTTALAMAGRIDEAGLVSAAMHAHRHPGLQYLDPARAVADGWVAAGRGALGEAIATVRAAAETACRNGQHAVEVMCLQTAAQFGDASTADRLHQLEHIVEGPRVGVAARFADALHSADGTELESVSERFEALGDLVGALDAAAHAAVCFRRSDLRGSALRCSTRADTLAALCGARTPAYRQAAEKLPLTDREREIAVLLGEGMSNRDIACRLTLSVRTVESHIYNAMSKTGMTSREDLGALLTGHLRLT